MKHRTGIFLILMAVLILPYTAFAEPSSGIMVWNMKAKEGVTQENIDSLTDFLTSEVERFSGLSVISEADLKSVLEGEQKKQQCGSEGDTCLAEIGSAMGVPEAVTGNLGRVGKIWILNLSRISIENMKVKARSSRQVEGEITDVVKMLSEATEALFENEIKANATSSYQTTAYATFFPGLALVILGGVGSWQWQVAADDADAARKDPLKSASDAESKMDLWTGVSATAYTLGGILVVTGAVFWILDAVDDQPNDSKTSVNFGFGPQRDGFSVSLYGRF